MTEESSRRDSDSGRLTFERNISFSRVTLYNYWKVIPQFVPLDGLHTDICVLRIGAVQAERGYVFVQWKFVWEKIEMSVTCAYIECATGKGITR